MDKGHDDSDYPLLSTGDLELVSRYLLTTEKQKEKKEKTKNEKQGKRRSLRLESWRRKRKSKDEDAESTQDVILPRAETAPTPNSSKTATGGWLRWARRASRELRGINSTSSDGASTEPTLNESWTDYGLVREYWESQGKVSLPHTADTGTSEVKPDKTTPDISELTHSEAKVREDEERERREKQKRMLLALSNLNGAKITRRPSGGVESIKAPHESEPKDGVPYYDEKQLEQVSQKLENLRLFSFISMMKLSGGPTAGQRDEEFFDSLRAGCDEMLEDTLERVYSFKKQKKSARGGTSEEVAAGLDAQNREKLEGTLKLYKTLAKGATKNEELLNLWRSVENGEKREEWDSIDLDAFIKTLETQAPDPASAPSENDAVAPTEETGSARRRSPLGTSDHEKKAAYLVAKLQKEKESKRIRDEFVGVEDLLRKYYDGTKLRSQFVNTEEEEEAAKERDQRGEEEEDESTTTKKVTKDSADLERQKDAAEAPATTTTPTLRRSGRKEEVEWDFGAGRGDASPNTKKHNSPRAGKRPPTTTSVDHAAGLESDDDTLQVAKSKLQMGQEMGLDGSERGVQHLLSKYYGKNEEDEDDDSTQSTDVDSTDQLIMSRSCDGLIESGHRRTPSASSQLDRDAARERDKVELVGDDYPLLAESDGQVKMLVDMVIGKEERRNKRRKEKEELRNKRKSRELLKQQPGVTQSATELSLGAPPKRGGNIQSREKEILEELNASGMLMGDREKDRVRQRPFSTGQLNEREGTLMTATGATNSQSAERTQKRASRLLFLRDHDKEDSNHNNNEHKETTSQDRDGEKEREKEKEKEKEKELALEAKKQKKLRRVQPRENLFVYTPSDFFGTRNKKEDLEVIKKKLRKVKRHKGDRYEGVAPEDLGTVEGMMERFFSSDKLMRRTGEYVVRVKLMLEHLKVGDMTPKVFRELISPRFSDYGLLHAGLQIGPYILEWGCDGLVVPRPILNNAPPLLLADFPDGLLYQGTDYEQVKIIFLKITEKTVEWNIKKKYANLGIKTKHARHCQHYIREILGLLSLSTLSFEEPLRGFLENLRTQGNGDMEIEDPFSGKKIVFDTHQQLDEYVKELKESCPELETQYPGLWQLLKAFDRAFWALAPEGDNFKRTVTTGCPFKSPLLHGSFA